MSRPHVSDDLWTLIEPLIPVKPRRRTHCGRLPIDHRNCLSGILFVLFTGIQWEHLPREFGCSGMTCWRRLRDWQAAGVWDRMHRIMLDRLNAAERIDWSRAIVDSSSVRAVGGARHRARTPRTAGNPAPSTTF